MAEKLPSVKAAGTYRGKVSYAMTRANSNGNPMVEIMWELENGEGIGQYFTKNLSFNMDEYNSIKTKLGLKPENEPGDLVGKKATLNIVAQKPVQSKGKDKVLQWEDEAKTIPKMKTFFKIAMITPDELGF